jgi:hypothetical protein
VDDVRLLDRLEHAAGLGRVTREGLLAHHVLARACRGERDLGVRMRRGRDRDDLDAGQRERALERGRPERDARALRPVLGSRRIAADQRVHLEARGAQRAQVGEHAEARANDDRARRGARGHQSTSPA